MLSIYLWTWTSAASISTEQQVRKINNKNTWNKKKLIKRFNYEATQPQQKHKSQGEKMK